MKVINIHRGVAVSLVMVIGLLPCWLKGSLEEPSPALACSVKKFIADELKHCSAKDQRLREFIRAVVDREIANYQQEELLKLAVMQYVVMLLVLPLGNLKWFENKEFWDFYGKIYWVPSLCWLSLWMIHVGWYSARDYGKGV